MLPFFADLAVTLQRRFAPGGLRDDFYEAARDTPGTGSVFEVRDHLVHFMGVGLLEDIFQVIIGFIGCFSLLVRGAQVIFGGGRCVTCHLFKVVAVAFKDVFVLGVDLAILAYGGGLGAAIWFACELVEELGIVAGQVICEF